MLSNNVAGADDTQVVKIFVNRFFPTYRKSDQLLITHHGLPTMSRHTSIFRSPIPSTVFESLKE